MLRSLLRSQSGFIQPLLIIATFGIVAFLVVASSAPFKDRLLGSLFPKQSSLASTYSGEIVVGPNETHKTINAGITAAGANYLVKIHAGTYPEQVEINKRVSLAAFGDGPVWVDGGNTRSAGIHITAADLSVDGIGVKQTKDQGVLMDTTTPKNVTLQNMTIQDFDSDNSGPEYNAGIGAWYTGPGMKILNNTILRRSSGNLTGGISNGIWFKSNSENPSGGGHLISGNIIKGTWDGIGGETEDDPRGGYDRDSVIENNTIDTCYDDGISVEGGGQNIKIRHNTIKRCGLGIANAPTLTGPLYIEYNRITDGAVGVYGNTACFKMGNQGTGLAYYTGNTCILTSGDGWQQTNSGMNAMVVRKNKIQVARYVLEHTGWTNSAQGAASSFDQDCLYTTDSTRFVKWNGSTGSTSTFAGFRSSTGNEANGVSNQTCPDPVDPDFSLAIDASPTPSPSSTSATTSPSPIPSPSSSRIPSPSPSLRPSPSPSRIPSFSPAATRTPTPTPTPRPVVQMGNLTGTITDANNLPLRNARAVLNIGGRKKIFYTNSSGAYLITKVPPAIYLVKYAKSGYNQQFINVTVNAGQTTVQNVKLIRR